MQVADIPTILHESLLRQKENTICQLNSDMRRLREGNALKNKSHSE